MAEAPRRAKGSAAARTHSHSTDPLEAIRVLAHLLGTHALAALAALAAAAAACDDGAQVADHLERQQRPLSLSRVLLLLLLRPLPSRGGAPEHRRAGRRALAQVGQQPQRRPVARAQP
jgi:hypothetical protein